MANSDDMLQLTSHANREADAASQSAGVSPDGDDQWQRLNLEAQQELAAVGKRRSDRVWFFVLVIATLVLLASLVGLANRVLRPQTLAAPPEPAQAQDILPVSGRNPTQPQPATQTAGSSQGVGQAQPAQTAAPTVAPVAVLPTAPAYSLFMPFAMLPLGEEAAALEAAYKAATQVSACFNANMLSLVIVSGPTFTPATGTKLVRGAATPAIQAAWVVENNSPCDWKQVAVLNSSDLEMLTPGVKKGEAALKLQTYSSDVIKPGEQATIQVDFRPEQALNVQRDWVLVINGLFLYDQPHLEMNVEQWVELIEPTATVRVQDPPANTSGWNWYPTQAPAAPPAGGPPSSRP